MENRFDTGREALKLVALTTMTVDHIGAVLFPQNEVLRIVGRLSFPLYCYLIVLGFEDTRSLRNYFLRLILFAFVSQTPFYLALGYQPLEVLNIFFTLAFGILSLTNPLLILPSVIISYFLNFDYGPYGIALILSMRILRENTRNGVILAILLNIPIIVQSSIQPFSILALPMIILHNNLTHAKARNGKVGSIGTHYPSWRKYFFYVYYPLHLTILYAIKTCFRI